MEAGIEGMRWIGGALESPRRKLAQRRASLGERQPVPAPGSGGL